MRLFWLLVFLAGDLYGMGGDTAPVWLKGAAGINGGEAVREAESAVLFDEGYWEIANDGTMRIRLRYAVKILKKEGRGEAEVDHYYNRDYTVINDFKVWLIQPGGAVIEYGKKQILDQAILGNDLYSESRRQSMSLATEVKPGSIFAYEIVKEQRALFSQIDWWFQSTSPVVQSRLMVSVPEKWRVEGRFFNRPAGPVVVNGSTHVWEVRDLAGLKYEEGMPGDIRARMVVNLFPPAGESTSLRPFKTWQDISKFLSELSDPQSTYNAVMERRARELTAGMTNEFERIRAIGKYAQAVNYVSIQTDLGRGGGYRPKPATKIFESNYGDCKDKANLMRAMLKALQIESYPVTINATDRSVVREGFPSLHGFNHCILAVRVGAGVSSAAVVEAAGLGRLLLFDPTDPYTPLGEMPAGEQGAHALVLAGADGVLIRTPEAGVAGGEDEFETRRTIGFDLEASGQATGRFTERAVGRGAAVRRAALRRLEKTGFGGMVEKWVTRSAPFTRLENLQMADEEGHFQLTFDFSSPMLANSIGGRLLVFRPALFGMADLMPGLTGLTGLDETRTTPLMISAWSYQERVEVMIPEGFRVDELPEPFTLRHVLGSFSLECRVEGRRIVYQRSLRMRSAIVEPAEHQALREFLGSVGGAESAMITFVRR